MLFFQVVGLYFVIGLVAALAFVAARPGSVLEPPTEVSTGARLLLMPGAMILWPVTLARWLKTRARA